MPPFQQIKGSRPSLKKKSKNSFRPNFSAKYKRSPLQKTYRLPLASQPKSAPGVLFGSGLFVACMQLCGPCRAWSGPRGPLGVPQQWPHSDGLMLCLLYVSEIEIVADKRGTAVVCCNPCHALAYLHPPCEAVILSRVASHHLQSFSASPKSRPAGGGGAGW